MTYLYHSNMWNDRAIQHGNYCSISLASWMAWSPRYYSLVAVIQWACQIGNTWLTWMCQDWSMKHLVNALSNGMAHDLGWYDLKWNIRSALNVFACKESLVSRVSPCISQDRSPRMKYDLEQVWPDLEWVWSDLEHTWPRTSSTSVLHRYLFVPVYNTHCVTATALSTNYDAHSHTPLCSHCVLLLARPLALPFPRLQLCQALWPRMAGITVVACSHVLCS